LRGDTTKRITIVIPTYWSRKQGEAGLPEDSIFDHPTPIDGQGTLGRCLESFKSLSGPGFNVLLITAPVSESLAPEVEAKIETIITPFRAHYPVCQFGPSDLIRVRRVLQNRNLDPALVSLQAYAQIRNCQILGSVLLESDLIVGIDDDEVVPPDYLEKALESVDAVSRAGPGERAAGIAGIYLDGEGEIHLKTSTDGASSANKFIRKAVLINDQFDALFSRSGRIVETPVALGGNMVFTPELFLNVAFDPGITRGEDIDYLMNSRLYGYRWMIDKELSITHLPPKASSSDPLNTSAYAKLQQDVLRFFYQREKIEVSRTTAGIRELRPEEFGIYPGEFLRDDLERQALEALVSMRPEDADERFFPQPEVMIETAKQRARKARDFTAFNTAWKQVLAVLQSDRELKETMLRKLDL